MAQLEDIQSAQRDLEQCFLKKMDELQAQLQSGGAAKDTVAKVAEEFRSFRELVFSMLGLLRKQINECARSIDIIDSRQRRKTLIFSGIAEKDKENCASIINDIVVNKMAIRDLPINYVVVCHRLGSSTQTHPRPILVKFSDVDIKSVVWRAKTKLKGSSVSVKEFLTRSRQAVFLRARIHFGMRDCWTQDGVIVVKGTDGSRHKLTSMEELLPLLQKYPKTSAKAVTARKT